MQTANLTDSNIGAVTSATFMSTLSSLLYGYCTAAISGAIDSMEHNFVAPLQLENVPAKLLLGFLTCSLLIGTIVGSLISRHTDRLMSRKMQIALTSVLFLVSAVGSAFPETGIAAPAGDPTRVIWAFVVYRLIGGIAVGVAFASAARFVTEFAPRAVHGQLGAYRHIAIMGGICIALLVNWGIALQGDDEWVLASGWRYMLLSSGIPALAFFWLSLAVPESGNWMGESRDGPTSEAKTAPASPEPAPASARPARQPVPLFAFGARVVVVGVALAAFQHLLGVNAISYYGVQILEQMGFSRDAAFLGMLVARTLDLLASTGVVLIVERVGRKPLLVGGAVLMGASMMTIGALFQSGNAGTAGLAAVCCYNLGFGVSFGPVAWIALSEIFPAPIRAQAFATCAMAQWAVNGLVSITFPLLLGGVTLNGVAHHEFAFWLYGALGLLAALIVLRFLPETKGIDLQRLEAFWRNPSLPVQRT